MLIAIGLIALGFFILMRSADLLVDNASELAQHFGVSTFLIGVLVIGFGTSAPEMVVSAVAALQNKGGLALGNALGSNITNIGLVLGCAALLRALPVSKETARKDIPMIIVSGVMAAYLIADGELSRFDGIILIVLLASYLFWSASKGSDNSQPVNESELTPKDSSLSRTKSVALAATLTVVSIALLITASRMLVYGAVHIANHFGVSDLVIGLTIIAIGTSLPELAAAIAAARKGAHDMIVGNIIGSNVFNTLGVLGITGLIRNTEIDASALIRDFPIMLGFSIAMLLFALTKGIFSRREGLLLVIAYLSYICYLLFTAIQ